MRASRAPLKEAENPEIIAKHAIRVLERAIHQQFGIDVHAGAELECSYRIPPSLHEQLSLHKHPGCDLLNGKKTSNYTSARKQRRSNDPAKQRLLTVSLVGLGLQKPGGPEVAMIPISDSLFPDSSWIAYSYKEDRAVSKDGWVLYEHVITHRAPHSTRPAGERMVTLSRAIEALRKTIASTPADRHHFAKDPIHSAWIEHVAHHVSERSTRARGPDYSINGLHLNISLTYQGKNLFTQSKTQAAMRHMLNEFIAPLIHEENFLLLSSPAALSRSFKRSGTGGINLEPSSRMEIRTPSAESNPYYTSLIALAAIYRGLKEMKYSSELGQFAEPDISGCISHVSPDFSSPKAHLLNAEERFFHPHNILKETLNQLEPELGERFVSAIKQTPPGCEKSRKEAGIVGPERSFK